MKVYMKDNFCTIYKLVFSRINRFLEKNGYKTINDPNSADICVLGLCGSFEADDARSVAMLNEVSESDCETILYGCFNDIRPELVDKYKQKYSSWDVEKLAHQLIPNAEYPLESIDLPGTFRTKEDYRIINEQRKFVGIATGCGFNCSFCPHKLGIGKLVSRDEKAILKQIKDFIARGVNTVIITATDTACYGKDNKSSFDKLMNKILFLPDMPLHLHIAQFSPDGLKGNEQALVDVFSDKRITDVQMPVQTSSSRILKLMNRRYNPADVSVFIQTVKENNPDIVFRTDLIVGFPTETIEELQHSIAFAVRWFDEVAVYAFELKDGTQLAKMNLTQFDKDEKERRRLYVIEQLKISGKLVHSGGQDLDGLNAVDSIKEMARRNTINVQSRQ